ncbi:YceH family protein [Aurantivibrio infirmus]
MTSENVDNPESQSNKVAVTLSEIEARVLGSLMEKQLTTPEAYPLTLNSLILACNQKSSREPIMNLASGEVQAALNDLQQRKLVEIEYGSRANRFAQLLTRVLFLPKPEQALVTIMILRGPQTINELFSRTQRSSVFKDITALEETLRSMCAKTSPVVLHIPRRPGQREDRYTHLLCGEPDVELKPSVNNPVSSHSSTVKAEAHNSRDENDLEKRVEKLESQVRVLLEQLGLEDSNSID